ncbi:MAG: hypothetical protein NWE93_09570 [Candidatus Bathyarchaeota archaeon]|nr:hypothetical protein [Candidatus Bathyarchaeota archaeon]
MADGQLTEQSAPKRFSSLAYALSWVVVIVSAVASGVSFFVPRALNGLAVMVGSARGTALVILVIAVPLLISALILAKHSESNVAKVLWLGSLIFILYNSVMFLFAIPYNSLFLVYVAMFSSAFWAIFTLLPKFKTANFAPASPSKTLRAVSVYLLIIAVFFYFQELGQYLPVLFSNAVPATYEGTGFLTNPSHVLDLAFILPLVTLSAVWMWQHKPHGNWVGGSVLVLLTIECVSIASDQYFGSLANPNSTVVSMAVVPLFAVLAVIGLLFSVLYFRAIRN